MPGYIAATLHKFHSINHQWERNTPPIHRVNRCMAPIHNWPTRWMKPHRFRQTESNNYNNHRNTAILCKNSGSNHVSGPWNHCHATIQLHSSHSRRSCTTTELLRHTSSLQHNQKSSQRHDSAHPQHCGLLVRGKNTKSLGRSLLLDKHENSRKDKPNWEPGCIDIIEYWIWLNSIEYEDSESSSLFFNKHV
jgi:hypothetical protein